MSKDTTKKIGWLGFHSGRPHLDDLLAGVLGTVLWVLIINFETVKLIMNASHISNKLARQMWEDGRTVEGEQVYAAWVGFTPNGGDAPVLNPGSWNPIDEHGSGDATDSATELVMDLVGDDKALSVRWEQNFSEWGVVHDAAATTYAVTATRHFVHYTTMKDNFPIAMRLGISWLLKQLNRTSCFRLVKDGDGWCLEEQVYDKKDIRRDLLWTHRLLITYTTTPIPHRFDRDMARVERQIVRWFLRREDVSEAWKPAEEPKTVRELLDAIEEAIKREKAEAKARSRPFNRPQNMIKKIEGLRDLVADLGITADWKQVETWLLQQWMGRNPNRELGMQIVDGTSIQDVVEHLDREIEACGTRFESQKTLHGSLPDGIPKDNAKAQMEKEQARSSQLDSWRRYLSETLSERVEDEIETRVQMNWDERMDERSRRSPYGVVMTTILLMHRARRKDGLTLREDTPWKYLEMALNAYWDKMLLGDHARKEIKAAERQSELHTPEIAANWPTGHEVPRVFWADSRNPELPAEARKVSGKRGVKRYPLQVITCEQLDDGTAYGSCYIGADQRYFGTPWSDEFFRELVCWLRMMELKRQNKPLPDDLDTLMAPDKLDDHVWFAHEQGESLMIQVMARSLHKRDTPGTQLDAATEIVPAVTAVYSIFAAWRGKMRYGGGHTHLSSRIRDGYLRQQIRPILRDSDDLADALQKILEKLKKDMHVVEVPSLPLRERSAAQRARLSA